MAPLGPCFKANKITSSLSDYSLKKWADVEIDRNIHEKHMGLNSTKQLCKKRLRWQDSVHQERHLGSNVTEFNWEGI
eukprot:c12481_g1_i1 orf=1-228(-)